MAYISASPFVYQNVVGLSAVGYGIAFGVNAVGLVSVGWVTSWLVDGTDPVRLVRIALAVQLGGTLMLVVLVATDASTWLLPLPIFVAVACNGGVMGNAAALAMSQVREVAGTGSAVLGCTQFTLGAVVSPLVGLGGEHSALVPALVMVTASALGFASSRLALSPARPRE
jgi:DHA1 family bicyclomycin/chloramphenicol resistance-like MFS transporter